MARFFSRSAQRLLARVFKLALSDQSLREALWRAVNNPPLSVGGDPPPLDPWIQVWKRAAEQTADYVEQHMLTVPRVGGARRLLEEALSRVSIDGLYLEFGSGWEAKSINLIAERTTKIVHGFDSFEGLPEDWFGQLKKGSLTSRAELPKVRDNVSLHAGWFDKTVPEFAAEHEGAVAFMHIDCDLYSSTKTVFDILGNRLVPGTILQFDEYFNYPGWREHEFKAFQELVNKSALRYEYVGYSDQFAVAVIMK